MPPEESIRAEASTVHRSGGGDGLDSKGSDADVEQIAQAKTVIRGSSRANQPLGRSGRLNQSPAEVSQVLLGQCLNHFRLEELIGGGGMGAVFRAHDEKLDRTVAIKVIPFVRDDTDLQRRYRNEAQSAAKLDHPRIARVFDAGVQDEWHYIVFEYIEGTNIRDLVNHNGVLSIDEAVFYTCQLADALQHAADRGIVHRDIKPSNVLIGEGGKIKLVDMGLARSDSLDLSEDMTASGVTLGTFDYISPEQARDPRDADLRSDLYSLGCTLYFMVTGQPPYPGGTMLQKLLSHGNSPPPNPSVLRSEVSENLVAVIQKMLAKNPSDRYQIAGDLIADLREVAVRDGLIRSQTLGPVTISEPNILLRWLEQHGPWAIAVTLLLAIGGWLHLDSAASRQDIIVPLSAVRPSSGSVAAAPSDGTEEMIVPQEPTP
ncbi:MAG: serine/threonine-protein kinase, partial [Rubripirellula sp.]